MLFILVSPYRYLEVFQVGLTVVFLKALVSLKRQTYPQEGAPSPAATYLEVQRRGRKVCQGPIQSSHT